MLRIASYSCTIYEGVLNHHKTQNLLFCKAQTKQYSLSYHERLQFKPVLQTQDIRAGMVTYKNSM